MGEYEINNACIDLRINICIYRLNENLSIKNNYIFNYETCKSNGEELNPYLPIILIVWIRNNHYELLLPNNLNKYAYPIELYKLKINTNNVKIPNINKIFSKKEKQIKH